MKLLPPFVIFTLVASCATTTEVPSGHAADPAAPTTPIARASSALRTPPGTLFAPSTAELAEEAPHSHGGHVHATPPEPPSEAPTSSSPPAVTTPVVKPAAKPVVKKPVAKVCACPMHPEVTSNAPGKCPKCKMQLVEVKK